MTIKFGKNNTAIICNFKSEINYFLNNFIYIYIVLKV